MFANRVPSSAPASLLSGRLGRLQTLVHCRPLSRSYCHHDEALDRVGSAGLWCQVLGWSPSVYLVGCCLGCRIRVTVELQVVGFLRSRKPLAGDGRYNDAAGVVHFLGGLIQVSYTTHPPMHICANYGSWVGMCWWPVCCRASVVLYVAVMAGSGHPCSCPFEANMSVVHRLWHGIPTSIVSSADGIVNLSPHVCLDCVSFLQYTSSMWQCHRWRRTSYGAQFVGSQH